MNRFKTLIAVVVMSIFFTGCMTNPYQIRVENYREQNFQGQLMAYEEAMQRLKKERIDVENQFIDLQYDYTLAVNLLQKVTGKSLSEINFGDNLSLEDIQRTNEVFSQARQKRIAEIEKSFKIFEDRMTLAKSDDEIMKALIDRINTRDQEQKKDWASYLKLLNKKIEEEKGLNENE